ncbi:MAG: histone deacetylase [Burkholderiaceae bacterium]|nr:histone deacetylase [Burkholderiaceae bacterium]
MAANAGSFAPSAGKPPLAVADWRAHGFPIDVRSFTPVDEDTLVLAHDPAFVRGVLRGEIANGFGNKRAEVAASLCHTTGAMLAAAEEALLNRRVACAPVSGFHHAGFAQAEGFCTFNGLMVTALALRRDDKVSHVGILDLDQHLGDGTDAIMQKLGTSWIRHHSSGRDHPGPEEAEGYLARLAVLVREFGDCDVLLYQAGADAHVKDPLGGWMTDEQLARRDGIVFETAAEMGLPVAWNLAGGYQTDAHGGIGPVLAIHRRTMQECVAVHVEAR